MKPLIAWAIVTDAGKVLGGDYRCAIYWTRSQAKLDAKKHPGCVVLKVNVTEDTEGK